MIHKHMFFNGRDNTSCNCPRNCPSHTKRRFFRYVRSPNRLARPRSPDSFSAIIPDDVEPWIAEAMDGAEYEVVPTGDNIASPVPDAADLAEQAELDRTADLITDG